MIASSHRPIARVLVFLPCIAVALSCMDSQVKGAFANEYNCRDKVDVQNLWAGRFKVTGCGRSVIYVCVNACIKESEDTAASAQTGMATVRQSPTSSGASPKSAVWSTKRPTPGGLVGPSGGWPEWTAQGSPQKAITRTHPLDGAALFELLAPSIVQIESMSAGAGRMGSGVAINSNEVLTNCHVVEGAKRIIVKQEKKEWIALLSRSDPATDRCVLKADGASFTPVPGVRAYKDLKVGEALFALGSPRGLELSISSGVLSGLRNFEGRNWVQTTAPISPGSSGGGLFDAYGNVVAITTIGWVGDDRRNQGLNFAIPADAYWQP